MISKLLIVLCVGFFLCPDSGDKNETSVIAVGDIMLGRNIGKDMEKTSKSYCYPYKFIKNLISSSDIAFANLESPISSTGNPRPKKFCFCASTKSVEGLLFSGFDVFSGANNHMMDYGDEALNNTVDLLNKNNIPIVGAGKNLKQARKPAIFKIGENRIAFLAYDCTFRWTFAKDKRPGTAPGRIKIIKQDIKKAKKISDIVLVSFHWGNEY
ncbi:MAG: CapA family protein, partial [Atribacterota bacterium]